MIFSRKEYWSGLPRPSPGDLPDLGIKPTSLMSPALAGGFFTTSATARSKMLELEGQVVCKSQLCQKLLLWKESKLICTHATIAKHLLIDTLGFPEASQVGSKASFLGV